MLPANRPHTWEKKMDCVSRYMLLGNMRVVSEQCNVPYDTLMDWKRSDWWPDMVDQIRRQKAAKTQDSLGKLVEQSLEVMSDRLEHGDFIYDSKSGKIIRKPVSVKDATVIASNLLQRQMQLEELAQKHEIQTDTVQETLKLLAKEFKKWNKNGAETIEFVEVGVETNAVHDQRKEGLQEGSGAVHEQTVSNSETSRAE